MIRDDPGERLVFTRSAMPGAEVMSAYGSLQPWHIYHEDYTFCACRTAASAWRYRHRTHELRDGSVMLLEPGELHRNTVVHERSDFKVIFFSPQLFEDAARELGMAARPHFKVAGTDNPRVFKAIYALSMAIESADSVLRQQTLFLACVRQLLDHAERVPAPFGVNESRAVRRAKAYLIDRFDEDVSLDELAAVAELSRFRLIHAFREQVGLPPHAFQIHVRIARARALLRSGLSAVAVAAMVGFVDQSHFTRHFKRIMRVTPGQYSRAQ